MPFKLSLPEHVANGAAYVPGTPAETVARQFGVTEASIIKLASNENPLGMSPRARARLEQFAGDLARYPDPDGYRLKRAVAAMAGLEPSWVTLGNGSSEILEMAGRAFLDHETSAVLSQYSFAVYRASIRAVGARALEVPAVRYGHDLPAMAAAIEPDTRLIFLANPNNPTGTYFPPAEFDAFMAGVDGRAVVVLDEAYQEYLDPSERFDSFGLVRQHPNLILARTFSKAYGLAGLRVGYALAAPELTDALNRVRPMFNVNAVAQEAAIAALEDIEFLERSRAVNDEGRRFLERVLAENGLRYVPTRGNFVLVEVRGAPAVNRALLQRGIVVRPVANYGLPNHLRISIGNAAQNLRLAEVLPEALADGTAK